MMYTNKVNVILHSLHQCSHYDDLLNTKALMFIQAFDASSKQFFDVYIIRQEIDGNLSCLINIYEDSEYLEFQSFSPEYLNNCDMWFKVYKRKSRPNIYKKFNELYQMKKQIK